MTPQSGITLVTEFSFSCVNWQDDDLPMHYEFIYFTNSDLLNVVYKGSQPSQHTKLPLGEREKNFTMDFRVRVADMFGAFTEVKTPVQVSTRAIEPLNAQVLRIKKLSGKLREVVQIKLLEKVKREFFWY